MNKNKILLIGAGFSANFGLPTTHDMWARVCEKINQTRKNILISSIYNHINYEDWYQAIISLNDKNLTEAANECLENVFMDIDRIALEGLAGNVNLNDLKKFILSFETPEDSSNSTKHSRLFSLNHDLVIERMFGIGINDYPHITIKEKNIVQKKFNSQTPYNKEIHPFEIEFTEKVDNSENNNRALQYYKLHGSFHWKLKPGDDQETFMIAGQDKLLKIYNTKLLLKYYQTFKESLTDNTEVVIIGYGFNDNHIIEALLHHNIRLNIISPEPIGDFYNKMNQDDKDGIKKQLWKKINHYYQYDLQTLFPKKSSNTRLISKICDDLEMDLDFSKPEDQ